MQTKDPRYRHVKTRPKKIQTVMVDGSRVEGFVHLTPNLRLSDQLNYRAQQDPFIAFTDTEILFPDGKRTRHKFLALNRNMIVSCFPTDGLDAEYDLFSDTKK